MTRPLIFIGTTNLDIVFYSEALPLRGQSLMGTIEEFGGGKGANQVVAAAQLGGNPFFATMFGEDDAADILTRGLADAGVNTSKIMKKSGHTSGRSLVFVGSDGANMIGIDAGANEAFSANDVKTALSDVAQDAVVVVEMGLPVDACRAAFEAKGERFLIFNPAPVRAQLSEAEYQSIDIITPNETEAKELTGLPVTSVGEAFDAAKRLHDQGVTAAAITLGQNGVVYLDGERRIHQRAFPVDAVDTTAAGDAFNGALATEIAKGRDIETALSFAVATASLSVTRKGAQQSMPTEAEVRQFLTEQGEKQE
jgi:ribokinase